mgnify:CR=1 FL=1
MLQDHPGEVVAVAGVFAVNQRVREVCVAQGGEGAGGRGADGVEDQGVGCGCGG